MCPSCRLLSPLIHPAGSDISASTVLPSSIRNYSLACSVRDVDILRADSPDSQLLMLYAGSRFRSMTYRPGCFMVSVRSQNTASTLHSAILMIFCYALA